MGRAFYLEVNSMDCIDDTSPARSGQRFALESDLQEESSVIRRVGVFTVVSSAGIFRKIQYVRAELPQRGIMR